MATMIFMAVYTYAYHSNTTYLKEISLSIGSSTLSIFLTIVAINRIDDKRDIAVIEKNTYLAFKQIRILLLQHVILLQAMYKAARLRESGALPKNLDEFFSGNFSTVISRLDISKEAPIFPTGTNWATYIRDQFNVLHEELGNTLAWFAHSLAVEDIELIENLRSHDLRSLISAYPAAMTISASYGRTLDGHLLADPYSIQKVQEHGEFVYKLSTRINKVLQGSVGVLFVTDQWRDDISPLFGTGM